MELKYELRVRIIAPWSKQLQLDQKSLFCLRPSIWEMVLPELKRIETLLEFNTKIKR